MLEFWENPEVQWNVPEGSKRAGAASSIFLRQGAVAGNESQPNKDTLTQLGQCNEFFFPIKRVPDNGLKESEGENGTLFGGGGGVKGVWTLKRPALKNNIFQADKEKLLSANPHKNADCGALLIVFSDGDFPARALP